jgi:hypothetical protein
MHLKTTRAEDEQKIMETQQFQFDTYWTERGMACIEATARMFEKLDFQEFTKLFEGPGAYQGVEKSCYFVVEPNARGDSIHIQCLHTGKILFGLYLDTSPDGGNRRISGVYHNSHVAFPQFGLEKSDF